MSLDSTRPYVLYTRPAKGPDPAPSEGAGDPNGTRYGAQFYLYASPQAINWVAVYSDGGTPQVTYAIGAVVASGQTSGPASQRFTRVDTQQVDDSMANFEAGYMAFQIRTEEVGPPVVDVEPIGYLATRYPLGSRWTTQTAAP